MVRHAPEHVHQRAALLARPDHVDIQIGKNPRLLGHRVGQTPAFGHFLPELAAYLRRNALGLQIRHALKRRGQRHSGLEQIRQLLGERGQFLQFRLALLLPLGTQGRRQERKEIHFCANALVIHHRAALGSVHRHRKKSEPFDLRQCRRAIGDVQNALDQFTTAAAGPIRKLRHSFLYLKPLPVKSFNHARAAQRLRHPGGSLPNPVSHARTRCLSTPR